MDIYYPKDNAVSHGKVSSKSNKMSYIIAGNY
jgi:hypothetical protein